MAKIIIANNIRTYINVCSEIERKYLPIIKLLILSKKKKKTQLEIYKYLII